MLAEKNEFLEDAAVTLRKLSAEEKIRMQCEAREDYYSLQKYIMAKQVRLENEKMELHEVNIALEAETSKLRKANESLEAEKSELSKANESLEAEKSELSKANENLEEEKYQLQAELDRLKEKLAEYEKK